jgi:hypothetical protein
MGHNDRREFLKQTAAGLAGASLLSDLQPTLADDPATAGNPDVSPEPRAIPPHRPLELAGLHAYAEKSVAAGGTIRFRVSSTVPYQMSVRRLGLDVDDPASDEVLERFAAPHPLSQAIHPGSYVHVDRGPAAAGSLEQLSIECWIRPLDAAVRQGLVTEFDDPAACAFGLFLDDAGQVAFYLGDGQKFRPEWLHAGPKLEPRLWHHLAGTWDGSTKSLWVDGQRVATWPFDGQIKTGSMPIRLAAAGRDGLADDFYDGDLALPAIYGKALTAAEIAERFAQQGLEKPRHAHLLACWPLAEERGPRVEDAGPHGRHGRIVNEATWMIGGPSFVAEAVPHFGAYHPAADHRRGHALRFASDDLYDCRWRPVHEYRIPADARSGMYAACFEFQLDGRPRLYHVTFVVTSPAARRKAPILVLCSTNTWLAYGATPFAENQAAGPRWGPSGLTNGPGDPPAYCFYRDHRARQPTYQLGLRMPWPAAAPDVFYSDPQDGYSHLARGERFTHAWLTRAGYEFDVTTDLDLDRDPGMLAGYKVLLINGHSEYWSLAAYHGVERFLANGGNLLVLSGNTMFWRVSFNAERTILECRKFDRHIGGLEQKRVGELWHSQDGRRGSLLRESGFPAWKLVGLDFIGWWSAGREDFGVYQAQAVDHFLFHKPRPVGLAKGATFGHGPGGANPRALGHEADVRLPTLRRMTVEPTPEGAEFPSEPAGISTLAVGVRQATEAVIVDYFTRPAQIVGGVCGEMIYWERPSGGRVFNAGAIAAGWALSADPKLQTLVSNVLHHFGVK